MTHVIIGLSEGSAHCLSKVNDLCVSGDSVSQLGAYTFFYINGKPNTLSFIAEEYRFRLPEKLEMVAARNVGKILASAIPKVNQSSLEQWAVEPSRRYYAELFKLHSDVFFRKVGTVVSTEKNSQDSLYFHLVVDISDVASSGIITELLLYLFNSYPQSIVFIYLFCSASSGMDDQALASMYAVLLEYNIAQSERIYFFPYQDYIDVKQSPSEICAQQIYSMLNASSLNFGKVESGASTTPEAPFLTLAEKIFAVDIPTLHTLASRQCALDVLGSMLLHDTVGVKTLSWIENMLDDKQWLLHMDFLSMDQDVYQAEAQKWVRVEQEWASRVHFFLDEQRKDQDWYGQIDNVAKSLSMVAQRYFRGRGIGLFYAVNDSGVSAVAKKIVQQIEEALIESWKKEDCSLMMLFVWADEIIIQVSRRLSACRNRRTQQCSIAKDELIRYQEVMQAWQKAGRMGQRKIERQHSIEHVIGMLERHYVADCNEKAMIYACKLLLVVLEELAQSKENLEKIRNAIHHSFRENAGDPLSVSVEKKYDSFFKRIWQIVPGSGSWGGRLLPDLCKNEILRAYVADSIVNQVDAQQGFSTLEKILENEKLIVSIARHIAQKYFPFGKGEAFVNAVLFWQAMSVFLADFQEDFGMFVRGNGSSEDVFPDYFWLLPSCSFDNDLLDETIRLCQRVLPKSRVLVNIDMGQPQLVLRQINSLSLSEFQSLEDMRAAYDRLIFSEYGAVWSLLLHTQTQLPYPDYESKIFSMDEDMHEVRQKLLLGDIHGVIKETANLEVYLILGDIPIRLGKHFPDAQESINAWKLKLLNTAITMSPSQMTEQQTQRHLQKRLNQIQEVCLNGKTDLGEADWQEAGRYVSWARAGEALLAE